MCTLRYAATKQKLCRQPRSARLGGGRRRRKRGGVRGGRGGCWVIINLHLCRLTLGRIGHVDQTQEGVGDAGGGDVRRGEHVVTRILREVNPWRGCLAGPRAYEHVRIVEEVEQRLLRWPDCHQQLHELLLMPLSTDIPRRIFHLPEG